MIWWLIPIGLYAVLGVYVGLDVHDGNQGIRYSTRSNPWVAGVLWLPIYLIVGAILLYEASGAAKPRR